MKKPKTTKVEVPDILRHRIELPITCGDCLFLHTAGAYKQGDGLRPCSFFGTLEIHDPCKKFTPNPKSFNGGLGEALDFLSNFDKPQLVFAALLTKNRLKRFKLHLGEKVYFHVLGGDYISNYASGRVVGALGDRIILEGLEGHTSQVKPESVLKEAAWMDTLHRLLEGNMINDPKGGLRKITYDRKTKHKLVAYFPKGLCKTNSAKKRKQKEHKTTVISLDA